MAFGCGELAKIITSSLGPPRGLDPKIHHSLNGNIPTELHLFP